MPFLPRYAIITFAEKKQHLGVAQLVARYLGVVEAVGSSPVTQTMRSVLIGFEYPIKDTPLFIA